MMRALHMTMGGLLGLVLLVGCGGDEAPAQTAAKPRKIQRVMVAQASDEPELAYRYDPSGKQDPFRSFLWSEPELEDDETPLERFDLSQLSVSAILWGTTMPRALITDPAGKGYIVREGAAIGKNKGRIVEIQDNVIRVKETYVDFQDRATTKEVEMRLYESKGG